MGSAGALYISIQGDTKDLVTSLKTAENVTINSGTKMEKSLTGVNRAVESLSTALKRLTLVGAIAGMAAYVYGMKKAVEAASDLQEVTGKFNVVFAGQKKEAESLAAALVDSYAMSTREAKQYLSSVQDLLVPMGMASDAALNMSGSVVKLAADLGSFNNLPTEQVMLDIQSALVGNFETMKKYGVILNETIVKEKAREMGLYSGKGAIDAT